MLTNNELTYELCCCSSVFHTVIPSVQALKASEQYAKLLGHQNTRQKIMHVKKLKDDNASLKQVGIRIHVQYMQYFIVSYLSLLRRHSYGPIELALVPFEVCPHQSTCYGPTRLPLSLLSCHITHLTCSRLIPP